MWILCSLKDLICKSKSSWNGSLHCLFGFKWHPNYIEEVLYIIHVLTFEM